MFFDYQVVVPIHLIVLQRIAGTIDIIKHYTNLPVDNVDDLAGIIDNPENGMLLDMVVHRGFNNYAWCLHPTVCLSFGREISDTDAFERMSYTSI
jgi:hypothetical protein